MPKGQYAREARQYSLSKMRALNLARILADLTPQRVGSSADFTFLAAIVREIAEKFPATEPPDGLSDSDESERPQVRNTSVSDYGSRIYG
jgi:hypothetical protein